MAFSAYLFYAGAKYERNRRIVDAFDNVRAAAPVLEEGIEFLKPGNEPRHQSIQTPWASHRTPEATITESSIFAAYRASKEFLPKDAGPRGKRSSYPFAQYRASGEGVSSWPTTRRWHAYLACLQSRRST